MESNLGGTSKMQAGKFVSASEISDEYESDLYPCYGGNGIRGYTKAYNYIGKYSLIGRQGALCGNVSLAEGKFYATEHALVVTPVVNIDTVWYYYLLNRLNLNQYATGMAQPGLSVKNLEEIRCSYPNTIDEQIKIGKILTLITEKIQTQSKLIQRLETLMLGLREELFTQNLRFKDEHGNDFPDWQKRKLGDVFYAEKGKGLSKNKVVENGKYECVLYGELYTKYNEVITNVISKTNDLDGVESHVGDLLIPSSTTTTGVDLANVTALNKFGVLIGGDITILRTSEDFDNIFWAHYLTNYKRDEISSYAQGSTIVHLYFNHFKEMHIDIPSKSEQSKIAGFLTSLSHKIENEKNLLAQYEQQKKYLLQQLFV